MKDYILSYLIINYNGQFEKLHRVEIWLLNSRKIIKIGLKIVSVA